MALTSVARVVVAGVCGVIIVMTMTAVVLHAQFAAGGYTYEAAVELPPWAIYTVIGGFAAGAVIGGVLGWQRWRDRRQSWR